MRKAIRRHSEKCWRRSNRAYALATTLNQAAFESAERRHFMCDLNLPINAQVLTPEQGLVANESQGIEVNKETFEDLLNETHRVNSFTNTLKTELVR